MKSLMLMLVIISLSRWIINDSSQDDVDEGDRAVDAFGVEEELTSLEKELSKSKRIFHKLWITLQETTEDDVIDFNQTVQTLHRRTRQIRDSLTQNLHSLNGLIQCLNICLRNHRAVTPTASAGDIRYFCNNVCQQMASSSTTNTTLVIGEISESESGTVTIVG